ncbi:hypothetical protein JCM5350_002703 [Sporobolomyces pararoseus]
MPAGNPFKAEARRSPLAGTLQAVSEEEPLTEFYDPSFDTIRPELLKSYGESARQVIDTELGSQSVNDRKKDLASELNKVLARAKENGDAMGVLKDWAKDYTEMYDESSQSQWAYENVFHLVNLALAAAQEGKRLTVKGKTRGTLGRREYELVREHRFRYIVKGNPQYVHWQIEETRTTVEHLVKEELKRNKDITDGSLAKENLSDWSARLKMHLEGYLRSKQYSVTAWKQVRYELERLNLLHRGGYLITQRNRISSLYEPETVLKRVKAW